MKVVQIPRRFEATCWGGMETVVLETSRRLLAMGHNATVLCPNALARAEFELMSGVPVRRVPYFYPYLGLSAAARRTLDQRGGNLFSVSLMLELWRREGLDLIHLHTGKRLGGAVRVVARLRRLPYIVSLHGGFLEVPPEESERYTRPTRGALEWGRALGWLVGSRRVLDDAAAVVCVSRHEQTRLRSRLPKQTIVHLSNGVDVDRFAAGDGPSFRRRYGINPSTFLITVVGRLDPQKNQALALGVLDRVRAAGIDAHLALVGPTTNDIYEGLLRLEIDKRGLTPHVTMTGNLDLGSAGLTAAYHAADLILLPSVHEPFGIAVLEAWAASKPVLASMTGGIPEIIADGENGLLFPSGDEVQAAVQTLALVANPDRRTALAAAGRAAVEEYRWERITARLLDLYREVRARSASSERRG